MHLKHACLPISPPEQVENAVYYTIFRDRLQGGIFNFFYQPTFPKNLPRSVSTLPDPT